MQTGVGSPELDALVSFTFPRSLGVPVPVLFAVGSEGLATALKSESFVVLHISEPTGLPFYKVVAQDVVVQARATG